MNLWTVAAIGGYLIMWALTWPAILAEFQQGHLTCQFMEEHYRHDLGAAMLFAALPPLWIVTPFVTGFYEHGLQFGPPNPDCRR